MRMAQPIDRLAQPIDRLDQTTTNPSILKDTRGGTTTNPSIPKDTRGGTRPPHTVIPEHGLLLTIKTYFATYPLLSSLLHMCSWHALLHMIVL